MLFTALDANHTRRFILGKLSNGFLHVSEHVKLDVRPASASVKFGNNGVSKVAHEKNLISERRLDDKG